jgi:hypothetical protein
MFVFFVNNAEPVFVSESDGQFREGLVRNSASQLTIQRIHSGLA